MAATGQLRILVPGRPWYIPELTGIPVKQQDLGIGDSMRA